MLDEAKLSNIDINTRRNNCIFAQYVHYIN